MGKDTNAKTADVVSEFGADNLQIEETAERVTISFDPRVILSTPFSSGKNRVASTGAFEKLRKTGIRVMLHVGTIVG